MDAVFQNGGTGRGVLPEIDPARGDGLLTAVRDLKRHGRAAGRRRSTPRGP
jgi:hypothetical protein